MNQFQLDPMSIFHFQYCLNDHFRLPDISYRSFTGNQIYVLMFFFELLAVFPGWFDSVENFEDAGIVMNVKNWNDLNFMSLLAIYKFV